MGKVKIKKQSVWIDMTPMSDVMVLLLTFFMLTSTFVKNEAVKVVTPGSVSEIKVPENDVLIRFALMATHTTEQVDEAVAVLTRIFRELGIIK